MMPPPPQQDPGGTVPFYLVAPTSTGPGPSFAPPGFPHQCGVAQPPLYLSPAVPPGGPPPLAADAWPEERINQETGLVSNVFPVLKGTKVFQAIEYRVSWYLKW